MYYYTIRIICLTKLVVQIFIIFQLYWKFKILSRYFHHVQCTIHISRV